MFQRLARRFAQGAQLGAGALALLACIDLAGSARATGSSAAELLEFGLYLVGILVLGGVFLGAVCGLVVFVVEGATASLSAARARWIRALCYAACASAVLSWQWIAFLLSRWEDFGATMHFVLVAGLILFQVLLIGLAFLTRVAVERYRGDGMHLPGFHGLATIALAAFVLIAYLLDRSLLVGQYPRFHLALAVSYIIAAQLFVWAVYTSYRHKRPRTAPGARWRLARVVATAVILAACLLVTSGFGASSHAIQFAALQRTALQSKMIRIARALSDFDRDGYASVLGGGDCDDGDPRVHPGAVDLPGNGIDEDCSGSDLGLAMLDQTTSGPPKGRRPPMPTEAPPGSIPRPSSDLNVLLISVDAVRADHLGLYRYSRDTSPHIDEFARRALVFERGYAQSNDSGTSMPSLITGRYPSNSAWQWDRRCERPWEPNQPIWPRLNDQDNVTLPELLRDHGYVSGIITTVHQLLDQGIPQGFDEKHKASKADLFALAESFVRQHRDGRFFLWMHVERPHYPYEKHAEFDFGPRMIDCYDSEIAKSDEEIGTFLRLLEDLELLGRTMIVITSDHGEEFHEHGGTTHTTTVYEEQIHVPLIVYIPGVPAARIGTPVELVDVVPTVLDVLGVAIPDWLDGASLLGDPVPGGEPVAYSERLFCGVVELKTLLTPDWKLIVNVPAQTKELYDLESDPGEQRNVADEQQDVVAQMSGRLDTFLLRKDLRLLARARQGGQPEKLQLAKNLQYNHQEALLIDAAELLAASGVDEAAPYLAGVARRPGASPAVRRAMFRALQALPGPIAVRTLLDLSETAEGEVQAMASRTLGRRADRKQIDRLRQSRKLRQQADRTTDTEARRQLYEQVLEQDPGDRAAEAALATIKVVTEARVRFAEVTVPPTITAGGASRLEYRLVNESAFTVAPRWQVRFPGKTRIVAEWIPSGSGQQALAGGESHIPYLGPGKDGESSFKVTAPPTPGRYTLRLTLAFEGHRLETGEGANLYEAPVEVLQ
jgi:arylsulfatase A-like enzyme